MYSFFSSKRAEQTDFYSLFQSCFFGMFSLDSHLVLVSIFKINPSEEVFQALVLYFILMETLY